MKNSLVKIFLTIVFLTTITGCENQSMKTANAVQTNAESLKKAEVARVWRGRTIAAKADEYEKYLYEAGVKKLEAIDGNLGVQMMRRDANGKAEFTVISY